MKIQQSQPAATPTSVDYYDGTPEIIADYYSGGDNDGLSGGARGFYFNVVVLLVILVIALGYRKYRHHHTFIITQSYPIIMVASCAVTTSKPVTYAPTPTFGYTSYAKKVPIIDYTPVSSTINTNCSYYNEQKLLYVIHCIPNTLFVCIVIIVIILSCSFISNAHSV